jgi:S-adenosylmethionine decarboxylase
MTLTGGRPLETAGTHFVVEYSGCDRGILDDEAAVEALLVKAAESTGATIVARVFHRFRPSGVTGCVMLADSHLTIHTWPECGYASVDLYTSRVWDPHRANAMLEEGLRAEDSQILVVDRGLPGPEKMRVQGHRRVASYTLDCRSPQLPDGVHVGRSPGRGFGLFASRDFASGELIYESPATLAEWDAEFTCETDLGKSVHSADSLGYELHPPLIESWSEQVRHALARHYDLQDPPTDMILRSVTCEGEREVLITAFDGLKNHSNDPNTVMDWPAATIAFDEEDEPIWTVSTRAIRPISAGDELFVDYRGSLFDFVPPIDWLA